MGYYYLSSVASVSVGSNSASTYGAGGNTSNWGSVSGDGCYYNDYSAGNSVFVSQPISGSITTALSPGAALTSGIYNSVSISATKSLTSCPASLAYAYMNCYQTQFNVSCSSSFSSYSGVLTITRQGNV